MQDTSSIEIKKVLVMCQRKSGENFLIEQQVVPKIYEVVYSLLGYGNSYFDIKYVSGITRNKIHEREGEGNEENLENVDYKLELTYANALTDANVRQFIEDNINSYALIILNTCPYSLMDFRLIHDLLEPNGLLFFSAFQENVYNMILNEKEIGDIAEKEKHLPVEKQNRIKQIDKFIKTFDDYQSSIKEDVKHIYDRTVPQYGFRKVPGYDALFQKIDLPSGLLKANSSRGGKKRRCNKRRTRKLRKSKKRQTIKKCG